MPDSAPDLEKLAALLDDSDEDVAINVIAALLDRSDELGDLPARLQEDPDPLVRRRAHQLQAAMVFRQRRQDFYRLLQETEPDIFAGLIMLHLLWFDKDNQAALQGDTGKFILSLQESGASTLSQLAALMRQMNFSALPESSIHPEAYCIGTVIDQHSGAGSLLAVLLANCVNIPGLHAVRVLENFALYDGGKELLLCTGNWPLCAAVPPEQMEVWDNRTLLKYCGSILFANAVNSDSFRYVLTIAQALSGDRGDGILDYMPYPYCGGGETV